MLRVDTGWPRLVLALLASGCSLDWEIPEHAEPITADAGLDATLVPDAPSFDATPPQLDGASGSDAGVEAAVDAAVPGCHANAECDAGAFCHFPDHKCGQGGAGTCLVKPATGTCPASTPYACACNGSVDLSGPCGSESNGIDVSILGCSSPPPGSACGYIYCITACLQHTVNGEIFYDCQ